MKSKTMLSVGLACLFVGSLSRASDKRPILNITTTTQLAGQVLDGMSIKQEELYCDKISKDIGGLDSPKIVDFFRLKFKPRSNDIYEAMHQNIAKEGAFKEPFAAYEDDKALEFSSKTQCLQKVKDYEAQLVYPVVQINTKYIYKERHHSGQNCLRSISASYIFGHSAFEFVSQESTPQKTIRSYANTWDECVGTKVYLIP